MKVARNLSVLLLVVALGISMVFIASAADATNFGSGVQVQNLSETDAATVIVTAYNKDGSTAASVTDDIAAKSSKTYYALGNQPDDTAPGFGLPPSFNGSVIISSNTPLGAITNVNATSSSGKAIFASYGGLTAEGSSVTIPLIMKDNGAADFDTSFNVQNAGTSGDVTVTVSYTPNGASFGNTGCQQTATIKPGAAATFNQSSDADSSYTGCSGGLKGSDSRFVGSATVTSNGGNIVASAMEVSISQLLAFNGVSSGSTNPVFPLINVQPDKGWQTGINLVNTGDTATNVTVSYTPGQFGTACNETQTIPAKSSNIFALFAFGSDVAGENCANALFVGSGQVTTNSANMPLTAVVNQTNAGQGKGAANNSFNPSAGTSSVSLPLIMANNGRNSFTTGYSIVNVGDQPANITCTYTGSPAKASDSQQNVAPNAAMVRQNNDLSSGAAYVGSATCTATGTNPRIVGVVNENGINPQTGGDLLLVYEGFNK